MLICVSQLRPRLSVKLGLSASRPREQARVRLADQHQRIPALSENGVAPPPSLADQRWSKSHLLEQNRAPVLLDGADGLAARDSESADCRRYRGQRAGNSAFRIGAYAPPKV